jgi:glycosyltransferase involved in cell wall biosynthesis
MNVLWLGDYPHPLKGNPNRHPVPWMTMLANGLVSSRGLNLTILSYSSTIEQDEVFSAGGIDYIYLKVPVDKWDLLTAYTQRINRLRSYLASIKATFDLVHIHGSEQQYQVIGAGLSIPKVLSVQGIITEYYKILPAKPDYRHVSWLVAGYYERKYLRSVRHFICRTHWDQSHTLRMQPNAVIHHNWEPIRAEFFEPVSVSAKTAQTLLFVGGTNRIKGIREALRAYDSLCRTLPLRFCVAGSGDKADVIQLVHSLQLANIRAEDIEHKGFLNGPELREAYQEAFCLIHPSYIDNSPNSVCEAQVAGLPVVASDVGGVSSLIDHGQTGLLTTLEPESIADAVMTLWENPKLHQAIAFNARAVARSRHDKQQIVDKTVAIYQEIMSHAN